MAAFDTSRPSYGATGLVGRIGTIVTALLGAFAEWNDARATRGALSKLSDHELADIGLSRGDIDSVSR